MILTDIRFNNFEDGDNLAATAGTTFRPPNDVCIARVTSKGELLGGVLLTNWTGFDGSAQMHVAAWSPRWLSRMGLWIAFDYAFNQLRVRKIFAQVPLSNSRSLAFTRHIGFKQEHIIKDAMPDGDIVLMAMYRSDCRFLNLIPRQLREKPDGR